MEEKNSKTNLIFIQNVKPSHVKAFIQTTTAFMALDANSYMKKLLFQMLPT